MLAALVALAVAAPERPPNVVLILADDLGWAELGCYGQTHIRTPHLDRLAADGARFTRFYAGNAVCAPSRCCLLTGRHPGHAAVRNNKEVQPEGQHPLPADAVTVATLLKQKGYATAAAGKWGLGPFGTTGDPLRHGFDIFLGYNCQRHAHTHYPTFLYRNAERFQLPGNDGAGGPTWSHDLFEAEAVRFIRANATRPFFLYLPVTVPHVAVQAPAEAVAEYQGKLGDDPAYDGSKGYRKHPAPHAGYAAMVSRLDRTVGRVRDALTAAGVADNTLVLFTSDNGPTHNVGGADSDFFRSAGGLKGLKGSLYEGGIRVPLLAAWPGRIPAGRVVGGRFAFWDVLPTLCELAGAATPTGTDGVSLVPALTGTGEQPTHQSLYWEFPGYGGQQAVIRGDWKLVRRNLAKGPTTELFDLAADPNETTDRAKERPEIVRELLALATAQRTPNPAFPLPGVDGKPK
jgi:arylsulfatase